MKLRSASIVLLLIAPSAFAHTVARAKAAELTLHRIERLVILNRIELDFQEKLKSMSVELIAHSAETDPAFKTTTLQYTPTDGTQKSIEVVLSDEGKALSYTLGAGGPAAGAPSYAPKDAVSLAEAGLHYILDNSAVLPALLPYDRNLSALSLSPSTLGDGTPIAVLEVQAEGSSSTLKIQVKLDGTVLGTNL